MKVDGTDAKDIAIYFFDQTNQKATPQIFSKTIVIAKSILKSGYSKQEIFDAIDYLIAEGVPMYSLGYLSASINDVIFKMNKKKEVEKNYEVRDQLNQHLQDKRAKGSEYEINTNNRNKRKRLGIQSKFREKFDIHMLEKSR